jgi:hypothetical protein
MTDEPSRKKDMSLKLQQGLAELAESLGRTQSAGKAKPRGRPSKKSADTPRRLRRSVGGLEDPARLEDLWNGGENQEEGLLRLVSDIPEKPRMQSPRREQAAGRYKPRNDSTRYSPSYTMSAGSATPRYPSAGYQKPAQERVKIMSDWDDEPVSSWEPRREPRKEPKRGAWLPAAGSDDPELLGVSDNNDPSGEAALYQYLQDNYSRIKLTQACRENIDQSDPEGNINLEIWYKSKGRWDRMDQEVQDRWARRSRNNPDSVCASLVKDLLGLSEGYYEMLRRKFENMSAGLLEGIYKATNDTVAKFAVVVEMPSGMGLNSNLVKGGLGALGLTTLLGTGAYFYQDQKIRDMYRGKGDYQAGIKVLERDIEDVKSQLDKLKVKPNPTEASGYEAYTAPPDDTTGSKAKADTLMAHIVDLKYQLAKYKFRNAQQETTILGDRLVKMRAESGKLTATTDNKKKDKLDKEIKELEEQQKIAKVKALKLFGDFDKMADARTQDLKRKQVGATSDIVSDFEGIITQKVNDVVNAFEAFQGAEDAKKSDTLKTLKDASTALYNLKRRDDQRDPWWKKGKVNLVQPITNFGVKADAAKEVLPAIQKAFPEVAIRMILNDNEATKDKFSSLPGSDQATNYQELFKNALVLLSNDADKAYKEGGTIDDNLNLEDTLKNQLNIKYGNAKRP